MINKYFKNHFLHIWITHIQIFSKFRTIHYELIFLNLLAAFTALASLAGCMWKKKKKLAMAIALINVLLDSNR